MYYYTFMLLFFYYLPFSHGFDFYDVSRMEFSSFGGFNYAVGFDEAVFQKWFYLAAGF